jgi:opacity protein-like surface antigen
MKRVLSTTFFAMMASTALAADPVYEVEQAVRSVSGYGQIYVGGVWVNFDDFDDSAWTFGGSGQVNVPFADFWNVQGGLTADAVSEDGTLYALGGAVHVNWRDPSSYALGVFADATTYEFSGDDGFFGDIWDWRVGPEAQIYFDRVTLYGQAYYGQLEIDEAPVNLDQMGVRGVVRYFAQDNLRFDGEIGFHQISADGEDGELNTFSAALQAMYRFDGSPLSVFGRYQFDTTSVDWGDLDVDTHKVVVGLRASFGTGTLLEEDRNGATMDTWRSNMLVPLF